MTNTFPAAAYKDVVKVMNLEEVLDKLSELMPVLREKYNVSEMGVFGSYATGEQREEGDVDILVEFNGPMSLFKYVELQGLLQDRLNKKVDLVHKKGIKPLIKDRIINQTVYLKK
jgi:predicted nucleotidyltransferase